MTEDDLERALEETWRTEGRQVVAALARRLRDLDLAEDAVQEAIAAAVQSWGVDGMPERPVAWLSTTAWRRALDALRRDSRRSAREQRYAGPLSVADGAGPPEAAELVADVDDVLSLVLTCCHPALAAETQVALTLRHVIGLGEEQISSLLLVTPAAVAKRLVRARRKITESGMTFELPDSVALPARLDAAMSALYLVFTHGYTTGPGLVAGSTDLAAEAIRLTTLLQRLAPDHLELRGLLALLLLQNSRADARSTSAGLTIPFDDQDQTLWRMADVERAKGLLTGTDATAPGPYRLEAAIALLHATRPQDSRRWTLVCELYDALERITDSPVVRVNAALAQGGLHGPEIGLQHLDELAADARLRRYRPCTRHRNGCASRYWRHRRSKGNRRPARSVPTRTRLGAMVLIGGLGAAGRGSGPRLGTMVLIGGLGAAGRGSGPRLGTMVPIRGWRPPGLVHVWAPRSPSAGGAPGLVRV